MRAVRIYEYGGPSVLKYELDAPKPDVGPHSVLIEASATSVNPIDWKVRSGARQKDFPLNLPAILGRDVSGTVRMVGSEVRTFKPGDRVIALTDAAYAEQVVVPAAELSHLPDGVDPIDAAAIPLVSMTGEQLIRLATQATPGQTVVIVGALGSVGRAAVHAAKKLGVRVIAAVRGKQLAAAEKLDIAGVLALDDDDALARLELVDGVADTVGGEAAAKLFAKLKVGGRFGYASVLSQNVAARYPEIIVSRVYVRPDAAKLREFAEDVRAGEFTLPISQRLPLSQAAAAHDLLEKGGGGKIVLTV